MKKERKPGPRGGSASRDYGKPRGARPPARFSGDERAPRPSRFRGEERPQRPARFRGEEEGGAPGFGDPYQHVKRPARAREEGGRGFTVTLDPDVARVFRGDASVNKALRLVLQLMQVVQGPPRPYGERPRPPRSGYQGGSEARGFTRKPRFEEAGEGDVEE
ncbi:MAG: hypothetical protein ACM3PU_03710 [Gemmatimonadota bacterium]